MKIIGYSERGIVNALFYEINYSAAAERLLELLLSRARFPFVDGMEFRVSDVEVLIEQSFSDFGDADALLLINTGKSAVSVFVEAKVEPSWTTIEKEFQTFIKGTRTEVNSSNLFTQLYHKVRMVAGLHQGGIPYLQKGIEFPKSSKKKTRKIGNNNVVLKAVEKLTEYLEETYYIAILPEQPAKLEYFFRNELRNWTPPTDYLDWDVHSYGYLSWSDVEVFCAKNNLGNTLRVFKFNEGQIYGRKNYGNKASRSNWSKSG